MNQNDGKGFAKMSKLKFQDPDIKDKRLKLMLWGVWGAGKTTAAIQFPNAAIIDTEHSTDEYMATIKASGSKVLHTNDVDEIQGQILTLLSEPHDYKTLIIDSWTIVYEAIQEKWERKFIQYAKDDKSRDMQDFGFRYWGRVKAENKALMRLLHRLDMNVILTCREKDKYEGDGNNQKKTGVQADGARGDLYDMTYSFHLEKRGDQRIAVLSKQRAEMNKPTFPDEFIWTYDNFLKFYGKETIERKATPVKLATAEQIIELNRLVEMGLLDEEKVEKSLKKAEAEDFSQISEKFADSLIDYCKEKVSPK